MPLPIGNQSQYNNVISIYQSLVSKGINPQAALDLVNQKVAEKGWTGYVSGDNKKFSNVDDFTDHLIDWHSRMYPDSLKAKNFDEYWKGIQITPKYKYNSENPNYKSHLLQTRPGVKKRINFYRKQQGLDPLALNTNNIVYAQKGHKVIKGKEGFKSLREAQQYIQDNRLTNAGIYVGNDERGEKLYEHLPLNEVIVTTKYPRQILKTININNGTLTFEEDKFGQKGWYRNHKPIPEDYKYWDSNLKVFRVLDPYRALSHVHTPYLSRLENEASTHKTSHGLIPIGNKYITLRTKGKMNLADVPVNLLDSIAINTGRSNTNIKTNLGLVGKESTFGGFSKALGNPLNSQQSFLVHDLTNNHAYQVNPQLDYLGAINRKFPKLYDYDFVTKNDIDKRDAERELEAKKAYQNNLIKSRTKQYHPNSLADAFSRYADSPSKYNPGQSNYVSMVNNIANEVWNEPQIQNWWKTEGIKYYNKGKNEK